MSFPRRRFVQVLSYAVGSSFMLPRKAAAMAAQNPARPANPAAPAGAQPESEEMEKVAGIGGLFFRAHDPDALARWYLDHLGITLTPMAEGAPVWQQEAGPTVFTPFPDKSGQPFGDPAKNWMVNFRVHHLDKLVAQLQKAGIEVKVDPQTYSYGRFARLHDPEGNPIELWQPA
jgi:glyoxylase I family protein